MSEVRGATVVGMMLATTLVIAQTFSVAAPAAAGSRGKAFVGGLIGGAILYGTVKAIQKSNERSRYRSRRADDEDRGRQGYASSTLSRAEVAEAQGALADLGLYRSDIDGKYGPGTRAAVRQFQRDNGYRVTGYLDDKQYGALRRLSQSGRAQPQGITERANARVDDDYRPAAPAMAYGEQGGPVVEGNGSQHYVTTAPQPAQSATSAALPPRFVTPAPAETGTPSPAMQPASPPATASTGVTASVRTAEKSQQLPTLSVPE